MNEEMSIVLAALNRASERLEQRPLQDPNALAEIVGEPGRLIEVILPKWRAVVDVVIEPEDAKSYARAALELLDQYELLIAVAESRLGRIDQIDRGVLAAREFWINQLLDPKYGHTRQ
jgi:hypothetical protein